MHKPLNTSGLPADQTAGEPVWDAIVIGAGPAGSVTARQLAAAGRKTLLVDRQPWPRGKVCGGYLNGQALAILESLGLGDALAEARPVALRQFALFAGHRRAELELASGVSIDRSRFDAALVGAAARAGVEFWPETRATVLAEVDRPTGFRQVQLIRPAAGPLLAKARLVIAADGLGHPSLARLGEFASRTKISSRLGLGITLTGQSDRYDAGVIYMAVAREGYVGLVRTDGGGLTLAGAVDAAIVRAAGNPAGAVRRILQRAGLPEPAELPADGWRGTPALTRKSAKLAAARVFLVGDAAAYVEPFTGEGMAWAIASAASVAQCVAQTADGWDERLARDWQQAQGHRIERGQLACRVLAAALRRPLIVGTAVNVLSRLPVLARPFVRRISAQAIGGRIENSLGATGTGRS